MINKGKTGRFITFEGIEGSGKTTQAKLLANYLLTKNLKVVFTREPGGTEIGEKIRLILADSENKISPWGEIFLFSASRIQHIKEVVLPALKFKQLIICDRFTDATLAYQGYGRGINLKMINQINNLAALKIYPDLTFLLDLKPEIGMNRLKKRNIQNNSFKDRIEKENLLFFKKVRAGYLKLSKKFPKRIIVLDAGQKEEIIRRQIIDSVNLYLKKWKF
ncbi:MAG: dTMP kinase [Armatimonadetes bacterium]|nr:dTMP kinase [Armatimonadota bacterium]